MAELELGRTAHTRRSVWVRPMPQPLSCRMKRRKAHMDSLRHARYRAEAKANSPIMEKESPVEEKVVSSTPVMRAPSAEQGKQEGSKKW